MVEVAVGQQDRDRLQPVLAQDLIELVDHADPRVDDHALLAGGRGHDPAVGLEGGGGEPADKHRTFLISDGLSSAQATGAVPRLTTEIA